MTLSLSEVIITAITLFGLVIAGFVRLEHRLTRIETILSIHCKGELADHPPP